MAGLFWFGPGLLGPSRSAEREAAAPGEGDRPAARATGEKSALEGVRRPGVAPDSGPESGAGEREAQPAPDLSFDSGGVRPTGDPTRFEGTGVLRGTFQIARSPEMPSGVSLELRPGTYAPGREHAVERSYPIADPSADFRFDDVPFGGYEVGARAPGWNSRWQSIVIERKNPNHFVLIDLEPAGFVEGRIVDGDQNPLEGLPVRLEPVLHGDPQETETDAFGLYRFESVLDGAYRLLVGHPESPLAPQKALQVRAPRLTVPTIELENLLTLEVLVLDAAGIPVPGATVIGSGRQGGRVEGETDARGMLVVPNLPQGEYRLRGTLEGIGSNRIRHALERDSVGEPAVIRLQ